MPDSCDGSHERGGRRTSTSTDCGDRFGSLMAVRAARIITNPSQEVTSLYINGVVAARETCQGPYAAAAAARNLQCSPERGSQKKRPVKCLTHLQQLPEVGNAAPREGTPRRKKKKPVMACQGPHAAAAAARSRECGPARGDQKKNETVVPV